MVSAATLANLKKLTALSDGVVEISESQGDDGTFYGLDIVLDGMGGVDPTAFVEPTFAFHKGYFLFALSRSDVKSAVKRLNGDIAEGDDVRSNPVFAPLLKRLPARIDAISFGDTAATVDGIYGPLSGLLAGVPIPADVPIDLGLLPGVDSLTDPLSGSLTYSTISSDGVRGRSFGPFGPELIVIGGVAIIGAGIAATVFGTPGQIRRFK